MTAHPHHDPHVSDHRLAPTDEVATLRDDLPRVAAPVPITVWRLDDRDGDQPAAEPGAGFASRLAKRLVGVYTGHGQSVVDLDDDVYLHHAASAACRPYLAVTEPDRLADLDQISQPVGLVSLRWPRTTTTTTPGHADQLAGLLSACRQLISGDASLVAAIRPGDPAEPGTAFADHEHTLRAAAALAGLVHVLQIVAIGASGEPDQFLYYATQAEATEAVHQATAAPGGQVLHIDLLVFGPHPVKQGRVTVVSRDG